MTLIRGHFRFTYTETQLHKVFNKESSFCIYTLPDQSKHSHANKYLKSLQLHDYKFCNDKNLQRAGQSRQQQFNLVKI